MKFLPTRLPGVCQIETEPRHDERGSFARVWCRNELKAQGLEARIEQINHSFNRRRGTLRGMHYQEAPDGEAKIVSCIQGALHDVVLDLRPESKTYLQWESFELTAENRLMVFIPAGCAHGFQTLADETLALYFMSDFHAPDRARGVRFDDAAFDISWPLPVSCLSDADRLWPDYVPRTARLVETHS